MLQNGLALSHFVFPILQHSHLGSSAGFLGRLGLSAELKLVSVVNPFIGESLLARSSPSIICPSTPGLLVSDLSVALSYVANSASSVSPWL